MLLKRFTGMEVFSANYFGFDGHRKAQQSLTCKMAGENEETRITIPYDEFNVEKDRFPYEDESFDVVLFCETIEHLMSDPVHALRQIWRILKEDGTLVVTTPNANRTENVYRMLAGNNIYDQYSGYGPYGRHNREYNIRELKRLLDHCGFDVTRCFTADVEKNSSNKVALFGVNIMLKIQKLILLITRGRQVEFGQYIYSVSQKKKEASDKKPSFLYRSYPAGEMETVDLL